MIENELPVYKEKLGKKEWWIEVRKQVKNIYSTKKHNNRPKINNSVLKKFHSGI